MKRKDPIFINCEYCGERIEKKRPHQRFCPKPKKCQINDWFAKHPRTAVAAETEKPPE